MRRVVLEDAAIAEPVGRSESGGLWVDVFLAEGAIVVGYYASYDNEHQFIEVSDRVSALGCTEQIHAQEYLFRTYSEAFGVGIGVLLAEVGILSPQRACKCGAHYVYKMIATEQSMAVPELSQELLTLVDRARMRELIPWNNLTSNQVEFDYLFTMTLDQAQHGRVMDSLYNEAVEQSAKFEHMWEQERLNLDQVGEENKRLNMGVQRLEQEIEAMTEKHRDSIQNMADRIEAQRRAIYEHKAYSQGLQAAIATMASTLVDEIKSSMDDD